MNPTPENETPLTDAATFYEEGIGEIVLSSFARELERDRKRLRDMVDSLLRCDLNPGDLRDITNADLKTQADIGFAPEIREVAELVLDARGVLAQSLALDAKLSKETE